MAGRARHGAGPNLRPGQASTALTSVHAHRCWRHLACHHTCRRAPPRATISPSPRSAAWPSARRRWRGRRSSSRSGRAVAAMTGQTAMRTCLRGQTVKARATTVCGRRVAVLGRATQRGWARQERAVGRGSMLSRPARPARPPQRRRRRSCTSARWLTRAASTAYARARSSRTLSPRLQTRRKCRCGRAGQHAWGCGAAGRQHGTAGMR